MNETRQLLKIFVVAVTDFEVEAEKLQKAAAQFSHDTGKQETANQWKLVNEDRSYEASLLLYPHQKLPAAGSQAG